MPLISVRRVVRAACKPASWRRASLEGARALAEVVAALTALTIWATSEVTALAAALLSLALEEALIVDRVDSRREVSMPWEGRWRAGLTNTGHWAGDG